MRMSVVDSFMAGYSSASWANWCARNGCITKDTPPPFKLPYTTFGYTPPQFVHILRQAEVGEKTIGQLCRDPGNSGNTFYRWRRRYGGMGLPDCGGSDTSSRRTRDSSGSWPSATWRWTPSGSCSQEN